MKYPAYPKYKESGVAWLGVVPEHWEVKRLKMSAQLTDKKVEADEDNPVPYIGLENIESWTGKLLPINPDVVPSGIANSFSKQNTLFGKLRPYLAKACNPNFDGLCSTELLVIESNEIQRRVLLYWLLADGFIKLVDSSTYGSKMPRANWDFIGNCRLPIPPETEQIAIADFLDRETGRIDTLVAKKRMLLDRLKEKRTALISRTVTRGLPAARAREFGLEPHTRFKDSGLEWLGEVPEGWNFIPLKHLGRIVSGYAFSSTDFSSSGVRVLKIANIQTMRLDWSDDSYLPEEFYEQHRSFAVKNGDVVFALTRPIISSGLKATVANIGGERVLLNQRNALFRPFSNFKRKFFYFTLFSRAFISDFETKIDATGQQPNISPVDIGNIKIVVPSSEEQTAIATYLDRETAKLDRLAEKVEAAIARLREYRTALITAAVTGKIDVREMKSKENDA